jgi:hypothetical protein
MLVERVCNFGPEHLHTRSAAICARIYIYKSNDLSDYGAFGLYTTAYMTWNSANIVGCAGKRSKSFAKMWWSILIDHHINRHGDTFFRRDENEQNDSWRSKTIMKYQGSTFFRANLIIGDILCLSMLHVSFPETSCVFSGNFTWPFLTSKGSTNDHSLTVN